MAGNDSGGVGRGGLVSPNIAYKKESYGNFYSNDRSLHKHLWEVTLIIGAQRIVLISKITPERLYLLFLQLVAKSILVSFVHPE